MKGFFKTFYGKLSALFLILLLVMGTVQILITINSWKEYYNEADQKLNQRLAQDMANELKPLVKDSLNIDAVHHSIHYMMVMNPKVEIYLLDGQGKILAFFAEPDKKVKSTHVGLNAVKSFLTKSEQLPILGDDPRNPGVTKPFSAARLTIGPDIDGYLYIILGSEQFDMAINNTRESYVAATIAKGLLITLVFTALLGLLIFAFLTKRLREMTKIVENFKKGIYKARIAVKSHDEIANLGITFNTMAETIEANIDELKKTDTLRRELIANVSHDLRSPLASVRGYLETIQMKDKTLSGEERARYINILLDSTNGLERLVEQLFELSKLDARQIEPTCEPFLLKEMVYDVMMKFKPRADNAAVRLKVDIPDGLPQVYADVGLIERVLSNLIENAIKYSVQNGTVIISTDKSDNEIIRVRVQDSGPGIKQDDIPFIFERFYRVDKSRSGKTGGTGLGLAIAKKIMEIHNSTISVVSELNKGSTFSFNLQAWHPGKA